MKMLGFVLGLLNGGGSFLTAAATELLIKILAFYKCPIDIVSLTLSDDGFTSANSPPVPEVGWSDIVMTTLNKIAARGEIISVSETSTTVKIDNVESVIPNWYWSKLYQVAKMMCMRICGTQPSKSKEKQGYRGEIMQGYVHSNGDCYIPLVRHTITFATELPGTGYSDDLIASATRLYEMVVNGADMDLYATMKVFVNFLVSDRYSLSQKYHPIMPIQFGGYYAPLFVHLKTLGFGADEARRLLWANHVPETAALLYASLHTDVVWQNTNIAPETALDVVTEDLETEQATEIYKKFSIRYAYNRLTTIAKKRVEEMITDLDLQTLEHLSQEKGLNNVALEMSPFISVDSTSRALKGLELLRLLKSRAGAEQYQRIPKGKRIPAQLGFHCRFFRNPFSIEMRSKGIVPDTPRLTYTEIIAAVHSVANSLEKIPRLGLLQKMLRLHHETYANMLSAMTMLNYSDITIRHISNKPIKHYRYIPDSALTPVHYEYKSESLLVAAYKLGKKENLVYRVLPLLATDAIIQQQSNMLLVKLRELDISSDYVIWNFRAFLRCLIRPARGITLMTTTEVLDPISVLNFEAGWSLSVSVVARARPAKLIQDEEEHVDSSRLRVLTLYCISRTQDVRLNWSDLRTTNLKQEKTFPSELAILKQLHLKYLVTNKFDAALANLWLLNRVLSGARAVFFKTRELLGITVLGQQYVLRKKPPYIVEIYINTDALELNRVLSSLWLISYFMKKRTERITDLSQIEDADESTEFYLFNKELVVGRHQLGWKGKSISVKRETLPWGLYAVADRMKDGYYFDKPNPYVITPWATTSLYTGMSLRYQGKRIFNDFPPLSTFAPKTFYFYYQRMPIPMDTVVGGNCVKALAHITGINIPGTVWLELGTTLIAILGISRFFGLSSLAVQSLIQMSEDLPPTAIYTDNGPVIQPWVGDYNTFVALFYPLVHLLSGIEQKNKALHVGVYLSIELVKRFPHLERLLAICLMERFPNDTNFIKTVLSQRRYMVNTRPGELLSEPKLKAGMLVRNLVSLVGTYKNIAGIPNLLFLYKHDTFPSWMTIILGRFYIDVDLVVVLLDKTPIDISKIVTCNTHVRGEV
jgi:hypothetical protein